VSALVALVVVGDVVAVDHPDDHALMLCWNAIPVLIASFPEILALPCDQMLKAHSLDQLVPLRR
jgi:hypothetical protein